jgi:uncharacterized protein (DUF1499 family)
MQTLKSPYTYAFIKESVKKESFKEVAQVCPKTNCQKKNSNLISPLFSSLVLSFVISVPVMGTLQIIENRG